MNPETTLIDSKENADLVGISLWSVFAACFLGHVFCGVISTLVSAYLPDILGDFGQSLPQQSQSAGSYINALYILGWAFGGMATGYVSDRIGRIRTIGACLVWLGIWTLALPSSVSWQFLALFRLMAGLGTGGVMVVAMTFLSEVWPQKSRTTVIGLVSVGFPIGIFSSGIITYLLPEWKAAMYFGLAPIVLAVFTMLSVAESKQWLSSKSEIKNTEKPNPFSLPNLWASTIIFGSMVIGLWSAFSWIPTWAQSLITDSDGQRERGIIMMLLGLFGILGGSFAGLVVKKIGVRSAIIMCFVGVLAISFALYGLVRQFTFWIYPLTAMLSFTFGISQGLLSSFVPQLFPFSVRAFATGISFNLGRIITAVAVFSIGSFVVFFGSYGNSLLVFSMVFIPGLIASLKVSKQTV